MKINNEFTFGTASSGPQSEGSIDKPNENIFEFWHKQDSKAFFNEIGPSVTSDVYRKYKEDVEMMKDIGFTSFRTSIQWSRLITNFDTVEVCEKSVQFYRDYFTYLIENGITPYVNLYHFDMPIELETRGGLSNKEVMLLYVKYAKKCFELFGDLVKYWFTFNEPIVPIEACYLYQFHYPLIVDSKLAVQAAYNTALASAMAIKEYRELKLDGEIGVILNLTPSYPSSDEEEDVKAAYISDLLFNRSFLDPALKGEYPKDLVELLGKNDMMPEYTQEELEIIRVNTIDYLGVNYYMPRRIKRSSLERKEGDMLMPEHFGEHFEMPGRRMNPYRGWEIYPEGLYDIAINLKDNYDNVKWFVSENGMGVENEERFMDENGYVSDDYRIEFIKEHLENLFKGINEGSNCVGYHLWTFVDNWSWANAYKNRYGYVSLNLETQERVIKKSGLWIKKVINEKEV